VPWVALGVPLPAVENKKPSFNKKPILLTDGFFIFL
jgi:hypothetical protein